MELGDGDSLERWLADVRADDARVARQRERWLAQQDAENATFVGTLVALAEGAGDVVAETIGGRRHAGRLAAVGLDFCALVEHGRWILVPIAALTTVRSTAAGQRNLVSDLGPPLDATLAETLVELQHERARLALTVRSGDRLAGTLANVGQDVLTLRLDGDERRVAHVPLDAVTDVVVG